MRLIDANALIAEIEERRQYVEGRQKRIASHLHLFMIDGARVGELQRMEMYVKNAPAVDAVEVVHGQWKKHYFSHCVDTYGNPDIGVECSECGFRWYSVHDAKNYFRYCPNCGAKMDGKEG